MSILWANSSKKLLKDAEKVFKSAAKLLLGPCYSRDELNELKWLNITEQSTNSMACLAYQSLHIPGPQMLKKLIDTSLVETISTRNRTHTTVDPRKCNDFIQFKATSVWLNLPENLRNVNSFDSFKHDTKQLIISERIHVHEGCVLSCIDQVIDNIRNLFNDT